MKIFLKLLKFELSFSLHWVQLLLLVLMSCSLAGSFFFFKDYNLSLFLLVLSPFLVSMSIYCFNPQYRKIHHSLPANPWISGLVLIITSYLCYFLGLLPLILVSILQSDGFGWRVLPFAFFCNATWLYLHCGINELEESLWAPKLLIFYFNVPVLFFSVFQDPAFFYQPCFLIFGLFLLGNALQQWYYNYASHKKTLLIDVLEILLIIASWLYAWVHYHVKL